MGRKNIEKILLKNGIIPLHISDNNTSLIGIGSYSKVFRVLYKGKPAIAKISENVYEFDMSIRLFNLKNKLGKLSKHIMEIYDFVDDGNFKILICEELKPLNPHLINLLFNEISLNDSKMYDIDEPEYDDLFTSKIKRKKS